MKSSPFLAVPLALACSLSGWAQDGPVKGSPWTETRFHRVHLRNGNFIDGDLVKQNSKTVILNMKTLGEFAVNRDMIAKLEYVKMRSIKEAPVIVAPTERPASSPSSTPLSASERPGKSSSTEPGTRRPSMAELPGAERFPAALRNSVDGIVVGYSLAPTDARTPLGPQIRALGPDAIAYACWITRSAPPGIEMPALITAVSELDHPEIQPTLLALAATAADSFDRAAAVTALAKRGTPEAIEAVHRAVGDPSGQVWRVATEEVAKFAEAGRANVDLLIGLLKKVQDKGVVARLLAKIGGEEAMTAVRNLFSDVAPKEKLALLNALGGSGSTEDMAFAHDLLDHADENIRKDTCVFLGKVKNKTSVRKLIDMLSDPEAVVVDSAVYALRRITGQTYGTGSEDWERWWTLAGQKNFPPPDGN